jgi:hypothetical protein
LGVQPRNVIALLARWCGLILSPGTLGEERGGVPPGIPGLSQVPTEPSPQPSPGVPGEGARGPGSRDLLTAFNLKRIPPTPIIMSPDDEPRA